jgi:ribonucleoside-diphosphate reductase alpha chain
MEVIKRNGNKERVSFDKIIKRIEGICEKLSLSRVDPIEISKETIQGLYDGITTEELDFFAAHKCAEKIIDDPEYNKLAAGLCVSNLHKSTSSSFMEVTERLHNNIDRFGRKNALVTTEYYNFVRENINRIQSSIDYNRDYLFDFFGIKTLERAYLIRIKDDAATQDNKNTREKEPKDIKNEMIMRKKYGRIVERPQHMIMRLALGIHTGNLEAALETYDLVSQHYFTHASPTLYNAGSYKPQLSSCYLLNMDDSIDGIFDTVTDAAKISKWAGGIGINLSNIRAFGSLIRGTNGSSDGIVPLIRLLNAEARYVNQGGRRNGAIAVYLEPWHADIYNFCELRKNTGAEELRARDIFLAVWVPDIFMKRVKDHGKWSLMCPDECPGLTSTYGAEFEQLYLKYESEGRYRKQVSADDLWFHILSAQMETGMPYMMFKDNVNRQSNQINIGVVQCSNLCSEIVQYSSPTEIAVCNLASICLPAFVIDNKTFDFAKLKQVAEVATKNLNIVIDINYYPVKKAEVSNKRHRPIGVGVQGLADVFCMMDLPFDSEEAITLNKKIFETIYFGCLTASVELAIKDGPYETFAGSPFSKGQLQYHLWGLKEADLLTNSMWDWKMLVERVKKHGTRNSLLTTVMPTASTSQIMGYNESIEAFTTNLYTRTTLAGEYVVVNKYLVEKLIALGLWRESVKTEFMFDNGSVQNIEEIPTNIKDIFKTAFEMKIKPVVRQAIARGPAIDQSQSMNLFMSEPDFSTLTSAHFYSWSNKLKTGMYYMRTKTAVDPIKFGLDPATIRKIQKKRKMIKIDQDDTTIPEDISDPRRISEIEINQKKSKIEEPCVMCSG